MGSPFPGMDPYLEDPARWPDVHLRLIARLGDVLMEQVRPRYVVRADERVYVAGDEVSELEFRPDLTVLGDPVETAPKQPSTPRHPAPVIVPTVMAAEYRERFLTLRARGSNEVVTVIEILSPTNKRSDASEGRQAYVAKRREVLRSASHLVEIDLLRAGQRVPMKRPLPQAAYYVIVSHSARRPRCEVFPIQLRERLPVVPIPLLGDEATEIDLQAILETVYERAGYDLDADYSRPPVPPLAAEDAAWAAELTKRPS